MKPRVPRVRACSSFSENVRGERLGGGAIAGERRPSCREREHACLGK
jgi:hypothetical protein